jgi:hypothetical protein
MYQERQSYSIFPDNHRFSFYRFLSIPILAFQLILLASCSFGISADRKSIPVITSTNFDGPTPITLPSRTPIRTERPSLTPTSSQTASPTFTLRPTFTPTKTSTPSPTSPTPTPIYKASIDISKYTADAGNFLLQAGEPVVITWENAPAEAIRYEFIFIHADDKREELIDEDYDDSQGVLIYWWVPAHLEGQFKVAAYFSDGHIISDIWGGTIWSGSYPPQGICSMNAPGIIVVRIFPTPDINQMEMAFLEPGVYEQVFERYATGWYLISTSQSFFPPDRNERLERGWVHEDEFFALHGPCDELPLK